QNLQHLAPVIRVDAHTIAENVIREQPAVFSFAALGGLLGGIVIDEAVALDDMEGFAIGSAVRIDHGIGADFDTYCIDDERIAFVAADGIPIPGRGDGLWM